MTAELSFSKEIEQPDVCQSREADQRLPAVWSLLRDMSGG